MCRSKALPLEMILARIDTADEYEFDAILQKLIRRYSKIHPETELMALTLPKNDPNERKHIYQWLLGYLEKYESLQKSESPPL